MKVCVISSTVFAVYPPGYAGLEVIAGQVAEGLARKGHAVSLIAPDGSFVPGVAIIPTGPPGQWDEKKAYSGYWQALVDVGKEGFDVIIDHSWAKFAYGLKAEGRLNAPVLGVCHAPVNTMYQSLPPVEKPCFVCISKDQAAHFEALFSHPARVAYNGVDLDFYRAIEGVKRSGRFLFLARFSTIKGPDLAIEACRKAGVGLDLVGDTSITNEPEYFQRCKEACDGVQIKMVGPATRGECVHWFSQAHCLLHPNQRFREPFGLAPVEAMACGCPVIAWDNGAMRETVKHGETGWLVRSMEEMVGRTRSYYGGEGTLKERDPIVRSRCREWASQFSVQKMVDGYEALCVEAIEGGGW